MASPDHWQAMQLTDAAVFYSKLTKWDEHFADLPPHTIQAQMYYTLAFRGVGLPPGEGHVVVNIGDSLEQKMQSIRCYQTQFPPEKAYVLDRVRAVAVQLGTAAGVPAGELLVSPHTLATDDLMRTVFCE